MKKIYATLVLTLLAFSSLFSQMTYQGNGGTGFGDMIGTGSLFINFDGTNINFILYAKADSATLGNNSIVIYIDNGLGGGFDSTGLFTDVSSGLLQAISGDEASDTAERANLVFPMGFAPQYALAFGSNAQNPAALLAGLASNNIFNYIDSPAVTNTDTVYSLSITPAQIGLNGPNFSFHFIATLISNTGYRSNEAIGINFPTGYGNIAWSRYADTSASLLFTTGSFPISLGTFNGILEGGSTDLSWTTKNEINTKEFNVQKSTDGVTWNTIGTVSSKNSADGADYGFIDNNVTASKNFYRLQVINDDGTFTYTSVIIINKNGGHSVILLGNPVTNVINLNISDDIAETYQLSLFTTDGKLLATQQFDQPGGTSKVTLNVPSIATGILLLRVTNGVDTDVFRVLAQ